MALLLRLNNFSPLLRNSVGGVVVRCMGNAARDIIGKREVVCYGYNGEPNYADRLEFPFPAIRWKEPTGEIEALRMKEKGDWSKLSIAEKKTLYRYSFRQTFAEIKAPSGEWKSVIGLLIFFSSFCLWITYFLKTFLYCHVVIPDSFSPEHRAAQFRRMIDLKFNPITGLGSEWDYDRDDWKR